MNRDKIQLTKQTKDSLVHHRKHKGKFGTDSENAWKVITNKINVSFILVFLHLKKEV